MSETTFYNDRELDFIYGNTEDKTNVPDVTSQEVSRLPDNWLITDKFIDKSMEINVLCWQFQQLSSSTISDYMKDVYFPEETLSQDQQDIIQEIIKDLFKAIEFDKEYLEEEGLELPNKEIINKTIHLIYLLSTANIFPKEITTTVEEGICLIFKNKSYHLYLELYNHGEIGYMLENSENKELIENEIYVSLSDVKSKISQLFR